MNLMRLMETFDSDTACREYLELLRWPDGVKCLRCQSTEVTELPNRNLYQCSSCRYQFSVTTGTIMHDSKLPLRKWLVAIYLIVESKKGISSLQLTRTLQVSPKTGWFLSQRIRTALATQDSLLKGVIEVDETWIGGKVRGKGRHYLGNKTMVIGAVERGGRIRTRTGGTPSRKELHGFIEQNISPDASAIYTDEHSGYGDLNDSDTNHERVKHFAEEWVRGDVHINTVESAWFLFKRGVAGSFHKVSRKHLDRYLDEFEFRFNNRHNPFIFRDALRELLTSPHIQYKNLTA